MLFKFIAIKRKVINKKNKAKYGIYDWMSLTKEERLELDSREKNESMRRKKVLLKSIRDEYIKIKKKQN